MGKIYRRPTLKTNDKPKKKDEKRYFCIHGLRRQCLHSMRWNNTFRYPHIKQLYYNQYTNNL